MRAPRAVVVVAILALALAGAQVALAQLPGQTQINAAKKAVAKTNEQTKAAEQAGGAQQQKKAAPPPQQQQKAQPPAQKTAPPPNTKTATQPNAKAAPPQKSTAKAGSKADTGTGAVSQTSRRGQVQILREQFAYTEGGRRDPFVSLMVSGELRPVITDLTITGVLWDTDPRKSLALLVDGSTGESYRVRVGQPLGRMRVTRIGREDITFTFDELGLSRTETLVIDRTKKAGPTPARRP